MKRLTAFFLGWLAANATNRAALHVVWSESGVGAEVRQKWLGKMEQEKLLRLEDEVQTEIIRRQKAGRVPEKIAI